MTINFYGAARPLADDDVRTIAGYLGCQVASVRAVLAVEAAGKGFDSKGRPKMLFEPHVFYRNLSGARRDEAVRQGLAYSKWGMKSYPADSYPRLVAAMAIDEPAALKAASWGLGQVLGENYTAAGFSNPHEMVLAMTRSEGAQLYAMARFIVTKGLQSKLRAFDWAGFARGYNGAGYKKNAYDTKLASAYAKRPAAEKVTPPPASVADLAALVGGAAPAPVPSPSAPVPTPPAPMPPDDPMPVPEPPQPAPLGFWARLWRALFG